MNTTMSKQETLVHLAEDGLIKPEMLDQARTLLAEDDHDNTPWYIHALAGFGAWISSVLFVIFAAMTKIIDSEASILSAGVLLLVGALTLNRLNAPIRSTYASQLLMIMSLGGHLLFSVGVNMITDSIEVASAGVMAISLVFILFYKQAFHQFLSMLIFFMAALVLAEELNIITEIMPVIISMLAGLAAWFWMKESRYSVKKHVSIYRNLQYALIAGLAISAGLLSSKIRYGLGSGVDMTMITYGLTAIGLFVVMSYLISQILQRLKISWQTTLGLMLLVVTAILSAVFYQTPAIMISLIVLVLGIERGNRILIPLATMGLIYYLGAYYHNLELTLLHKSLLLMASGLMLSGVGLVFYKKNQGGH